MKKTWWIYVLVFTFLMAGSRPGLAQGIKTGIQGLEMSGYLRNQIDVRVYSPNDIMRWAYEAAIRADYKPTPKFQTYLELRPFVDFAYDWQGGLTDQNRGVMGIEYDDMNWNASGPEDTDVGGYTASRDVLSTNMNNDYWLQYSFLREAWMLFRCDQWETKVGKQMVTWGKTDGIKLLDFVNPTDYRHFIIDDMEDSKIPIWMLNVKYYFNTDYNLQFLWIPWYVQNFQAPAGSPWAFNGVNLIYYYDHFDALNIIRGGGPAIAAETACTIDYNDPGNENEFGVRFEGSIGTATDYTLNFFYTHQKNNVMIEPTGYNPLQPIIPGTGVKNDVFQFVTHPAIQRIYGGSFDHSFNNFFGLRDLVMRGEMAYYYQTEFFGTRKPFGYLTPVLTDNPGGDIGPSGFGLYPAGDLFITKRDLLRAALGWDKNVFWQGLNWIVSLQLIWEHIFSYPHNNDNYISNVGLSKAYEDEFTWTFYANTDILNERVKFDNLFVWNQTQHDGWNRFKLGFDLSNKWVLWIGDNFFWGEDDTYEINPFVGSTNVRPGVPIPVVNPEANTIGNIDRGDPLGEFSRNHEVFIELKYLW